MTAPTAGRALRYAGGSARGLLHHHRDTILRSRTDPGQATEVAIAVHALNRMLELGRPKSVRIA
jgi:hypothetical protein